MNTLQAHSAALRPADTGFPSGVVFTETLRQHWKGILYWGGGLTFIIFIIVVIVPSVEFLETYQRVYELWPQLYQVFVGEDVSFAMTPEGYLTGEVFSWIVLLFAAYALIAGLNVTINAEDRGILDVELSLPIPRWRLIVERTLAFALIMLFMTLLMFIGLMVGDRVVNVLEIEWTRIAVTVFNILPSMLFVLAFTVLMGTLIRRRSHAIWLSGLYVAGGFVVEMLGRFAPGSPLFGVLRRFSYYYYYNPAYVIQHGLNPASLAALLGGTVVCGGLAVWCFQRRDLGI